MGWAFEQQPTGGSLSKLVLVALADQANHDNQAWPSVGYIARRCQMGESTVRAHLTKLESEGLLVRTARFTSGRQTSNVYYLPCEPNRAIPTESGILEPEGGPSVTQRGATGGRVGDPLAARGTGVQQRETEPTKKEPRIEPTATDAGAMALELISETPPSNTGPATALARIKPLPALAERPNGAAIVQRLGLVLDEVRTGNRDRLTVEQRRKLQAGVVFAYWIHKFEHPRALLDDNRERLVMKRLEENGGDISELLHALDGARNDGWVMGTAHNARHKNDGVDFILRDRASVERFANTRKKYRDGEPHELEAKYAAVVSEELGEGPAHAVRVAVIEPAGAGGGMHGGHQHEGRAS